MAIQMEPNETNEKEFVRIEEAATIFGVSKATMYGWIARYNIPRYKSDIDSVKYVRPAEIRAARAKAAEIKPWSDE